MVLQFLHLGGGDDLAAATRGPLGVLPNHYGGFAVLGLIMDSRHEELPAGTPTDFPEP